MNRSKRRVKPCEAIVAEFVFGAKRCGEPAVETVTSADGAVWFVCDAHLGDILAADLGLGVSG